jgi:hypothetical protein
MILPDPAPKAVVKALGDSTVELELRAWLCDAHAEREAYFATLVLAKKALDERRHRDPLPPAHPPLCRRQPFRRCQDIGRSRARAGSVLKHLNSQSLGVKIPF